jgi:hypothetical protein
MEIIAIIFFLGLVVTVVRLDRRVSKLEKKLKERGDA